MTAHRLFRLTFLCKSMPSVPQSGFSGDALLLMKKEGGSDLLLMFPHVSPRIHSMSDLNPKSACLNSVTNNFSNHPAVSLVDLDHFNVSLCELVC